jgi:hypothetical protein
MTRVLSEGPHNLRIISAKKRDDQEKELGLRQTTEKTEMLPIMSTNSVINA